MAEVRGPERRFLDQLAEALGLGGRDVVSLRITADESDAVYVHTVERLRRPADEALLLFARRYNVSADLGSGDEERSDG